MSKLFGWLHRSVSQFTWRERLFRVLLLFSIFQVSFYASLTGLKLDQTRRISKVGIKVTGSPNSSGLQGQEVSEDEDSSQEDRMVSRATRLPANLLKWAGYYHWLSIVLYCYLFCHHLAICLLDLRWLRSNRYLDCLLVGRFIISSRVLDGSKIFALALCIHQLVARMLFYSRRTSRYFRLICLEFMLFRPTEVSAWEMKLDQELGREAKRKKLDECQSLWKNNLIYSQKMPTSGHDRMCNSTVGLENQFTLCKGRHFDQVNEFILRPNRSQDSWNILANFTVYFLLASLSFSAPFLGALSYLFAPVILTRRGFELNYPNCVEWIKRQPQPQLYEHIYRPTGWNDMSDQMNRSVRQTAPLLLPYQDFQLTSSYNVVRAIVDSLVTLFFWVDIYLSITFHLYICYIVSLDVALYYLRLNKMIQKLLSRMQAGSSYCTPKSFAPSRARRDTCEADIYKIQSIIMDYFNLIFKYNPFINLMCIFNIFLWLVYTAIISGWFLLPKAGSQHSDARTEFAFLFGASTAQISCLLGSASIIRHLSRQLYSQMVRMMAFDENSASTKERWSIIVKFYWPRAMYCFTLFNNYELSWMFYLKVSLVGVRKMNSCHSGY